MPKVISISDDQLPKNLRTIIDRKTTEYSNPVSRNETAKIPSTDGIPGPESDNWLRIDGPICVYVDMAGSTQLSATVHPNSTARIYRYYVGTAIKLFDELGASYIDVSGDGVFAMFNKDQPHTALSAAVTFKTFFSEVFKKKVGDSTSAKINLGNHIGIDQRTILVKRIGLRRLNGRNDKQNEVWAGKTVNMAAKLASLRNDNKVVVSDRFYNNLTHEGALKSCGCDGSGNVSGEKSSLWTSIDLAEDSNFDFDIGYELNTNGWCKVHGSETINNLLSEDS